MRNPNLSQRARAELRAASEEEREADVQALRRLFDFAKWESEEG